MQTLFKCLAILFGLFCVSQANVMLNRRRENFEMVLRACPNITEVKVNIDELKGYWFLQMYRNEGGSKIECAKDNFKIVSDDGESAVVNSSYIAKNATGHRKFGYILTEWEQIDEGRFAYFLKDFPVFLVRVAVAVYDKDLGIVLETCMLQSEGETHFQMFTRDEHPEKKVLDELLTKADLAGVKIGDVTRVEHNDCPNDGHKKH